MLKLLGYASRAKLIDAVVPARYELASRSNWPLPNGEQEALDVLKAIARENRVSEVVHRTGLLRHADARRDPAQRPRESRLVHGVHAVSAGDIAGPARSAGQLSDDGVRSDRHGDRERVDARRGDRGGRGDGARASRGQDEERHDLRRRRRAAADDRRRAHAGRAARARSRGRTRGRRRRARTASPRCCNIPAPKATCATIARSSKRCTRAARS